MNCISVAFQLFWKDSVMLIGFLTIGAYMFSLGGGAISQKSTKHTIISRSTMQADFVALDLAGIEAKWLKIFFAWHFIVA